jgi:lactoylglutathione lyase
VSPATSADEHGTLPLVAKVDCVMFYVADLDTGLEFYRDQLGHQLLWRTDTAVGLGMSGSDAEIVLQVEREGQETDLKVDSADAAAARIESAGGKVIVPPFDIRIGRGVVVEDPWGNRMVLIDSSKGRLLTDESGEVTGVG